MSIALTLHLLAVIIWVGGMFFAHMVLRPVLNEALEPHQRLPLLLKVFDGFFPWVWGSVITILASGYWMLFTRYENDTSWWLSLMTMVGTLMAAIFIFIYAIPYHQLSTALKGDDMPRAVAAITLIRQLILVNLILGLLVSALASMGKYGFF
ncbi:MAG: CopD family protein [Candidatus Thiodiazotropha sp.]